MNHNTYIYALVDPATQKVFYIGRTVKVLSERLRGHLSDARRGKTNKRSQKVLEILKSGDRPEIREVAKLINASRKQAIAAEQAWIDFYRLTCELTNSVDASKGAHGLTPYKYNWGEEVLDKLGKTSDYAIAKQVGCCRPTISNLRRSLGIPAYEEEYPDEFFERLGKVSDRQIARDFKMPSSTVKYIRDSLNIPPFQDPRIKQWRQEHLELLGKMSDAALAEKIGCHPDTVYEKRRELKIKACDRSRWRERKDKRVRLDDVIERLGKEPDEQIAQDFGVTRTIIRKLRVEAGIGSCPRMPKIKWTEENIKLLGTLSDKKVAKILGCHSDSVFKKRKELGIPESNKLQWKQEWIDMINTVSAKELAKIIGCHPYTVWQKRKRIASEQHGNQKDI